MDRIMEVTGTPFVQPGDNTGYYIKCSEVSGQQCKCVISFWTIDYCAGSIYSDVLTTAWYITEGAWVSSWETSDHHL